MIFLKKSVALLLGVVLALTTLAAISAPTAEAAPWTCPAGSFEDQAGKCRVPVADDTACPKKALGVPGGCYVFVDYVESKRGAKQCPVGSVEATDGCRKPVADVVICPEGSLGVPGACYIVVPKVAGKTLAIRGSEMPTMRTMLAAA